MDRIEEKYEKQLLEDIEGLSIMEQGSEEKAREVENVTKMMRAREEKKRGIRDFAIALVGVGVTIGTFVAGKLISNKWYHEGLTFEETGSFVSKAFQEQRHNNINR